MSNIKSNIKSKIKSKINTKTKIITPFYAIPLATVTPLIIGNKVLNTSRLNQKSLFYNLALNLIAVGVNQSLDTKSSIQKYLGFVSGAYNAWFLYNTENNDNKNLYMIIGSTGGFLIAYSLSGQLIDMIDSNTNSDDSKIRIDQQHIDTPHSQFDNIEMSKQSLLKKQNDIARSKHKSLSRVFSATF